MVREIPKPPKTNNVFFILFITLLLFISTILFIHISSDHNTFADFFTRQRAFKSNDPCHKRYIFIQELFSKFNYQILIDCEKLLPGRNMCLYIQNDGFGPSIFDGPNPDDKDFDQLSWFDTNQFTLELIFHKRMKRYQCLTNDSSSANAIYVPFYTGLDAARTLWEFNTTVRDKVGIEFLKYISSLTQWKGLNGRDHFIIGGRIGWEFRRTGSNGSDWGSSLMSQQESKHMTMLTIEASSFKNDVAIPYPTYFHPSSSEQVINWQKSVQRIKRRFLFAYAGAPRSQQPIRKEILNQCSDAKEECGLLSCSGTFDPKCHQPLNVIKLFGSSTFCLQPPGDSPTRRSTFDAILSGCIPVFFRMESGPEQYRWHFPSNYSSYSVYIPEEDVIRKRTDIRTTLSRISSENVAAMRKEVIRMIPRVIYRNFGSGIGSGVMEKDAFDLAVDGILKRIENIKREFYSGNESGLYF